MNKLLYRTLGRFYLGQPEQQAQYVFQFRKDAPKELKRSFIVDLDKDGTFTGSALDVAYQIKTANDAYWINTDKPKIQAVVDYLEKWEVKDRFEGLMEEREQLKSRLAVIEEELSLFEDEVPA